MIKTSKSNSSTLVIALDDHEDQTTYKTSNQVPKGTKVPFGTSNSILMNQGNLNLATQGCPKQEIKEEMDDISIIEESYSCFTQNGPRAPLVPSSDKARRLAKKYNRKEKSLGELCKKFIYLYGAKQYCIIALDECTHTLGVERRRIYDIINILESFNVLSRLAKNKYEWRGIDQIETSIKRMIEGVREDFTATPIKRRKNKSLGILCESFIKQFLTWRETLSLEQAA